MPAASPGEAVATRLIADANVHASVADRIYPTKPTQNPTWPYVVYYTVDGGGDLRLNGRQSVQPYTVTVEVHAETKDAARPVMNLVATSLSGHRNTSENTWGIFPIGDRNELPGDDTGSEMISQSFRVFFRG